MSLENIARATLAGQNAPAVLHASEQAFLNQNILRIRDYVMGDPTSGGGAIFLDSAINRFFQDVHAARGHYANNPHKSGRNYGGVMLGMRTTDWFI